MNELVTLALAAAGAYIISKQTSSTMPTETTATSRTTAATSVEQAAVDELRAQGVLVTGLVDIQTAGGQTVTAIAAPTPEAPNRVIPLDPDDVTRMQGKYVPQLTITPAMQSQMKYLGYSSWNDLVPQLLSGRTWFYGPEAQAIKFPLADWEYWRTVITGGGGPPALTSDKVPPELWSLPLTQEEYFAVRDTYGLYPPSLRGLGCACAWAT